MITTKRFVLIFFSLLLICSVNSVRWHTVKRMVDGDTVVLDTGDKVRLLGVDTPETVHPKKPVECFGKEASEYTRKHLEGKRVRIVFDNPKNDIYKDRYGRWVAYIYLEDGVLFNAKLIREGYAHAYTRYPFSRMKEFRRLEKEARKEEKGLWSADACKDDEHAGGS
jgi:micrococcal nuclease